MEPYRTALAVKKMKLRHVVITSVDRDDLKDDMGSKFWVQTIKKIRELFFSTLSLLVRNNCGLI